MADEQIIIDIQYDTSKAGENVRELTNQIVELQTANQRLRQDLRKETGATTESLNARKKLGSQIEYNNEKIRQARKIRTDNIRTITGEKSALDKVTAAIDANTKKRTISLKGIGKLVAGYFGLTAAVAGVIKGIKTLIQNSAEFQKSLSSLQAITGASTQDMKFYEQQAKATSRQTLQSAVDIVKAYELVGSAQPELLKNKEALAGVTKEAIILSEATGGRLGLVEAAKATTGVMNQMGLAAGEARRVINTLAAGSKAGAAAIPELTEGYKAFGAVLDAANGTVEDGVALQEVLAEKQLLGAEAGTKLRNILITLQKDQKNYKDGTFNLNLALENLNKSNLNAVELTDLFGKQNVVAAQILAKNVDKFKSYKEAVTGTNTALEQQAIQNDNLAANWKKFTNRLKNIFTSSKIASFLNDVVKWILDLDRRIIEFRNGFVENFNDLIKESTVFRTAIQILYSIVTAAFKGIKTSIQLIIEPFKALGKSIIALLKVDLKEIGNIWSDSIDNVKNDVIDLGKVYVEQWNKIKAAATSESIDSFLLKIKEVPGAIQETTKAIRDSSNEIKQIETETFDASTKLAKNYTDIWATEYLNNIENKKQEIQQLKEITNQYLNEAFNLLGTNYDERYAIAQRFTTSVLELNIKQLKDEKKLADAVKNIAFGLTNDILANRRKRIDEQKAALDKELADYSDEQYAELEAFDNADQVKTEKELQREALEKDIKDRIHQKEIEIEKKKYEADLRQFRFDKANALIQAAINTALAVIKITAQTGIGAAIAVPVALGLLGIQTALIVSKKPPPAPEFAKGGELKFGTFSGPSHRSGGINLYDDYGNRVANVQGQEKFFVINKQSSAEIDVLDQINRRHGDHLTKKTRFAQEGGEIPVNNIDLINAIKNMRFYIDTKNIKTGLSELDTVINTGNV